MTSDKMQYTIHTSKKAAIKKAQSLGKYGIVCKGERKGKTVYFSMIADEPMVGTIYKLYIPREVIP